MLQLLFVPPPDSFKIRNIGQFIGAVGVLIFYVSGLVFLMLFVWGGLGWLTSGGDKAQLQTARQRITYALIGITIIAVSRAVLLVLEKFFGICILGNCPALSPGY